MSTDGTMLGAALTLGIAGAGGVWGLLHVAVRLARAATMLEAALGALGPRVTHVETRTDELEDGFANHETRITVLERMAAAPRAAG
jgi:hypothetical protein